jgi:hypothetical protein
MNRKELDFLLGLSCRPCLVQLLLPLPILPQLLRLALRNLFALGVRCGQTLRVPSRVLARPEHLEMV